MNSLITTLLQLVLSFLLAVQNNSSASVAQQQQAITVAMQAVQIATQALQAGSSSQSVTTATASPSCTFSANPVDARYFLQPTSTLSWNCTDATSCTINGNSVSSTTNGRTLTGTLVVPMTKTSPLNMAHYTLNCVSAGAKVSSDTVQIGDTAIYDP